LKIGGVVLPPDDRDQGTMALIAPKYFRREFFSRANVVVINRSVHLRKSDAEAKPCGF
jgi:hypothetical protein